MPTNPVTVNLIELPDAPEPAAPIEPVPRSCDTFELKPWPEHVRGAPNVLLRSALFGVVAPGAREYVRKLLLPTPTGTEVRYTGERLDQGDADVWLALVHLARERLSQGARAFLGVQIRIPRKTLLRLLGRPNGGEAQKRLDASLLRLQGGVISVRYVDRKTQHRMVYSGQLLLPCHRDETTGELLLHLNADLVNLFAGGWSSIVWAERRQLGRRQLAQWLHAFYCTHQAPYPMKLETLQQLSGARMSLDDWRTKQLIPALEAVAATGAITAWRIDDAGLVHVACRPWGTELAEPLKAPAKRPRRTRKAAAA